MVFSSFPFLFLFLPLTLIFAFLLRRRRKLCNFFLLCASLAFYAWGERRNVVLMIASIAANFGFGFAVRPGSGSNRRRAAALVCAVGFNLGMLFYFKYLHFAAQNLNLLLGTHFETQSMRLPIGISFFTFQAMSYVIDVYRGTVPIQKNPMNLGLYISFFPQLIAGPIVRYNTFESQIMERTPSAEKFTQGAERFTEGLSKKIILANVLAAAAEQSFSCAGSGSMSVAMAWLGALAFTFQIYFDFSGYSDMAIGLGKMFGFEFQENFRHPYLSSSVSEFWNRWHISLGQWFRDYVYFPMGGSRVSRGKLIRNLFTVWLLTGIWHGANWQFILWGCMYGCIITAEKLTGFPKKCGSSAKGLRRAYRVFTALTVIVGWVIFGAENLNAGLYQIGAMFGIGASAFADDGALLILREYGRFFLLAAFFSTPVAAHWKECHADSAWMEYVKPAVYLLLLVLCASFLAMNANNPFLYFNF